MEIEYHFLIVFLILSLSLIVLYFTSDCQDFIKVANTNDPRVDKRPIWLCSNNKNKISRITNFYNKERKMQSMGIFDKWSMTHVTHGFIIYLILLYINGFKRTPTILYLTIAIEIAWEIFENTSFIINKYRRSRTLYRDYSGDSIANMISDTIFTLFGVIIVWHLPTNMIIATIIFFEILTYFVIDDNILINLYSLTVA